MVAKWCQDGCFNADPHPGNILLLEDGHTLGLIDFGQVMYLPQVVRLKHIFESLEEYTKKYPEVLCLFLKVYSCILQYL